MESKAEARQRPIGPWANDSQRDAKQAWINSKVKAEFLDIDKHVGWWSTMILDQVLCRATEEGWLLIIKAHRNGHSYAAFIEADTMGEAYELAGEFAARGCLTWQRDKWPPKFLRGRRR